MKRIMTRSTPAGTQAITAAAVAILAVSTYTTSAFSPIISPQATTMQHRLMHISSTGGPMPMTSRLAPVRMSKLETVESLTTAMLKTEQEQEKKSMNPTPVLVSMLRDALDRQDDTALDTTKNISKNIQMTSPQWVVAAVTALALAFLPIQDANAAMSGGRMGGSFSAAPRQSISRPSTMRSSSSYNRGYSSSGYISRPGISSSIGYGSYGYYGNPFYSSIAGPRVYGGSGGMATPILSFLGACLAFNMLEVVNYSTTEFDSSDEETSTFFGSESSAAQSALGPGTSVVQLSVALEVPDRDDSKSILAALDQLSTTAKTDSRVGIQNLSSQVALEILRRRSSIVSASSFTKHFSKREKALREFQTRSIQERSKFESETVSRYGGVDYASPLSPSLAGATDNTSNSNNSDRATMAVITLVLAIDGDSTKLNTIKSVADVEEALQMIASDSKVSDCLQSAEILWTPEDRSETLSFRDVVADYPELRSL